MFDAAIKIALPSLWAADGVHPTSDGAALMARWWLKAVKE
jgi:lysophospholipase L1-like esterase